jgi:hypothetical protein
MANVDQVIGRAISLASVAPDGALTKPRSYGVYRLPERAAGRRYRFGNHPVRMWELEREFGSCSLVHLFAAREDAKHVAAALSGHGG